MAKIIAPFKIVGTLDDLNFYEASGQSLVREKSSYRMTKEQFRANANYDRIRHQATEFGSCSKKSIVFRSLAKEFYNKAKEVSFAGRVNKLLFEIVEEDDQNEIGSRKLENGLQKKESNEILIHFEGNKLRPLQQVLKKEINFDWSLNKIDVSTINPEKDINWPEEEANQVHLQLAIANWNYKEDQFENQYSNEIILEKSNFENQLEFRLNELQTQDLWLAFIFVGFSLKERKKTKFLHRKWNTTTIIGIQNFATPQIK